MAGKYGSASALFLVDGYNFLGAKLKSLSLKITSLTEPTDGLGDAHEIHTPTGKQQASLTQGGGLFDTSALNIHAAMQSGTPTSPQATARISVVGVMGNTVGAVVYGLRAMFTATYEVLVDNGKMAKANVEHVMAGLVERGQIVQPLATKTADWNTKTLGTVVDYTLDPSQYSIPIASATKANPCVVTTSVPHGRVTGDRVLISSNTLSGPSINSDLAVTVLSETTFSVPVNTSASTGAGTGGQFVRADSSGGCAAYQEVTAFSGFSGYVGKLRDSADDVTFADLATFADVTSAPNAQRVEVAGVVDRYVCHDGNVTGTGSIDVLSAIFRL